MADDATPIQFEDIPLAQARTMGRGPQMDPALYRALKEKITSLENNATRITIPEGISRTTMKNRILRVAAALNIPVTVRRVPGGLLFWHSSLEDRQQAEDVGKRLHGTRRTRSRPRGGRRRRA